MERSEEPRDDEAGRDRVARDGSGVGMAGGITAPGNGRRKGGESRAVERGGGRDQLTASVVALLSARASDSRSAACAAIFASRCGRSESSTCDVWSGIQCRTVTLLRCEEQTRPSRDTSL